MQNAWNNSGRLLGKPSLTDRMAAGAATPLLRFVPAVACLLLAACYAPRETNGSYEQAEEELEDVIVTASRIVRPPFWNTWFESGHRQVPRHTPTSALNTGSSYTMFIDLAGIEFDAGGVTAGVASDTFREILAESEADTLAVQLLVVTDRKRIQLSSGEARSKTLTVDVGKFEHLGKDGERLATTAADPFYSLGSAHFRMDTKATVGTASVGISIWANGIPVDQMLIPVCIGSAEDCDDRTVSAHSLQGLDSTRIGMQRKSQPRPDGAIHYVDLWHAGVIGVFRCNTCGWKEHDYVTWTLNQDAAQLQRYLASTIQPAFEDAAKFQDAASFQATGRDLYRLLLGRDRDAAAAFEKFFERSMSATETPSLFIRLLDDPYVPPLLVPLGLMAVPTSGNNSEFVGNIFRVETPLSYQDYSSHSSCLDRWTLLLPDKDEPGKALKSARKRFARWIGSFQRWQDNATVFESIDDFRHWLEARSQPFDEEDAVGVIILSHHESNRLYFNENSKTPNISSATVSRQFRSPSLIIINACGAASPGAADFVSSFNQQGVPTIVATSTTVDAEMAGDFMNLLAAEIQRNADNPSFNIGRAVFEAVQDLRTTYGAYALIYGLYGNGNLKVCFPP